MWSLVGRLSHTCAVSDEEKPPPPPWPISRLPVTRWLLPQGRHTYPDFAIAEQHFPIGNVSDPLLFVNPSCAVSVHWLRLPFPPPSLSFQRQSVYSWLSGRPEGSERSCAAKRRATSVRNRGEWTFFGGTTTSVVKKCHFIQSSVGAGGVGGGGGGGVFTMSSSKQSGVRASASVSVGGLSGAWPRLGQKIRCGLAVHHSGIKGWTEA